MLGASESAAGNQSLISARCGNALVERIIVVMMMVTKIVIIMVMVMLVMLVMLVAWYALLERIIILMHRW